MIPDSLVPLANHLWQSTLFATIAGLLTLLLRKNSARVRYWIWAAASVKFLVPFSLFIWMGSRIEWRANPPERQSQAAIVMEQVSRPFVATAVPAAPSAKAPRSYAWLPTVLSLIWASGFLYVSALWWTRWRRVALAVRAGSCACLDAPVPAISSPTILEPGVFGIFNPILLLPEGFFDRLTPAQWNAVIAHELSHIRHRDNLVAAMHMFVEALFWLHPVVWWLGSRMIDERERACDEEVLEAGGDPGVYAEGILNVCKLYVKSPIACMTGVSGANLRQRIEEIMANRIVARLSRARKMALAAAGVAALALPIAIGMMNALPARAQDALPQFEVASVKPVPPPTSFADVVRSGGPGTNSPERYRYRGASLRHLIAEAWALQYAADQVTGLKWIDEQRYEVAAIMAPGTTKSQFQAMLRNLLIERFHLKFHVESKQFAVLNLEAVKPTIKPSDPTPGTSLPVGGIKADAKGFPIHNGGVAMMVGEGPVGRRTRNFSFKNMTMDEFVSNLLTPFTRERVLNKTGLEGPYDAQFYVDLDAQQNPTGAIPDHPVVTFADAMEQQLGLRLRQAKTDFDVIVIESGNRIPDEN